MRKITSQKNYLAANENPIHLWLLLCSYRGELPLPNILTHLYQNTRYYY